MTLAELCRPWLPVADHGGLTLAGLTADSRRIQPGWLFVALPYLDRPGFKHDGHDFIPDAIARGAIAVLATDEAKARAAAGGLPVLLGEDTRYLLPRLAARWYDQPSRELRLVAITGTNGKTTTAYLLDAIFARAGWRTVLVGTVETRLAGETRQATTTTPDPVSLQGLWREAVEQGVTGGAMEVSSHALDQHRTDAIAFEVGVFTNLSQDHLDYHESLEDYFLAKQKLFLPDEYGEAPRAVLNSADPCTARLLAAGARDPITFGPGGMVRAKDIAFDLRGSRFTVETPAGGWAQELRVVGPYNVQNALGAIAVGQAMGLETDLIRDALVDAGGAPGRLEAVDEGQGFAVLVDYAHTPDALENALAAVRRLTERRVICVFGCGGDRDRTKRPLMGRIAAAGSDLAVVTSDNPRTEQPEAILADILDGIDRATCDCVVELDRATAIAAGLAAAEAGDVVLIAGKGHENYQILGETTIDFDDREIARDWLRSHG